MPLRIFLCHLLVLHISMLAPSVLSVFVIVAMQRTADLAAKMQLLNLLLLQS
jgi:hypothetical protein